MTVFSSAAVEVLASHSIVHVSILLAPFNPLEALNILRIKHNRLQSVKRDHNTCAENSNPTCRLPRARRYDSLPGCEPYPEKWQLSLITPTATSKSDAPASQRKVVK